MVGSVSGGCVESDVHERALWVLDRRAPTLVEYGPVQPDSFAVGLSCEGRIEVLIEAYCEDLVWRAVRQAVEDDRPAAMAVCISPARLLGMRFGIIANADANNDENSDANNDKGHTQVGSIAPEIDQRVAAEAERLLRTRESGVLEIAPADNDAEPYRVFIESFAPAQRLYLVGAAPIAVSLCPMAKRLGFRVFVIDPRTAFTEGDRFPDAHQVLNEWPVSVLDGAVLDADAYVLTLTHDPKFDLPTLARALTSDVRYIGALGSRATHAKRLAELRAQGFGDEALSRIKTPVGLDLGGRRPEEIALAILAEMVATRYERSGGSLSKEAQHGN